MKYIPKKHTGLSAMEMLVYVAILSLCTGILVRVMAGTFAVFTKARSMQSLTSSGGTAIERIMYNVRNAKAFSVSDNSFGTNPGTLSVVVTESGVDNTYLYTVTNGRLTQQLNGGAVQYLTAPGQSVTTFTVNQITAGSYNGAQVTITLSDGRISPAQTATFTTSSLMRGLY